MPSGCDDGPFGKGTGGQLRYSVDLPAGGSRTLWVAVAGSDKSESDARAQLADALKDPASALASKIAAREKLAGWSKLSLPGDPLLAQGVDWGKQNIADLTQVAENLDVRYVDQGKAYPPSQGHLAKARWIGAGFPDYPWIFATDAEYTSFASVATGQFEAIEDHMRVLRDISDIVNDRSGKVTHEITGDGANWFGQNKDPGEHGRAVKFPSTVALIWRWTGDAGFRDSMYDFSKRNLRYVERTLDTDGDGWPEGLGNVERTGMGPGEARQHGLLDPRPLRPRRHGAVQGRRRDRALGAVEGRRPARPLRGRLVVPQYGLHADSLGTSNEKIEQKHWITATPMEAELTIDRRAFPGLRRSTTARPRWRSTRRTASAARRPSTRGLFRTACGGGPEGKGERTIFSLNTAIQGVGEGNYGRLGPRPAEALHGRRRRADVQRAGDGRPDEQPGALPGGSCPRRTSSRSRRPTTRTSTAAGPAAGCSCRRGASTARRGPSCTSSSASARTWGAAR